MQLHKLRLHIVLFPRTFDYCIVHFFTDLAKALSLVLFCLSYWYLSRHFPTPLSTFPCPVSKQKSDPLYLRICRGAAVVPGPSPRAAIRNISFQDNWVANTFGTNGLKMRILTWILDTLPFFQLHNKNLPTGVCWAHLHHEISSWFLSSEFGHIFYQSGTPAKYILYRVIEWGARM